MRVKYAFTSLINERVKLLLGRANVPRMLHSRDWIFNTQQSEWGHRLNKISGFSDWRGQLTPRSSLEISPSSRTIPRDLSVADVIWYSLLTFWYSRRKYVYTKITQKNKGSLPQCRTFIKRPSLNALLGIQRRLEPATLIADPSYKDNISTTVLHVIKINVFYSIADLISVFSSNTTYWLTCTKYHVLHHCTRYGLDFRLKQYGLVGSGSVNTACRKVSSMIKSWHENFMQENVIFMHENMNFHAWKCHFHEMIFLCLKIKISPLALFFRARNVQGWLGCTNLYAWNFHQWEFLGRIFIYMHGNFIFMDEKWKFHACKWNFHACNFHAWNSTTAFNIASITSQIAIYPIMTKKVTIININLTYMHMAITLLALN